MHQVLKGKRRKVAKSISIKVCRMNCFIIFYNLWHNIQALHRQLNGSHMHMCFQIHLQTVQLTFWTSTLWIDIATNIPQLFHTALDSDSPHNAIQFLGLQLDNSHDCSHQCTLSVSEAERMTQNQPPSPKSCTTWIFYSSTLFSVWFMYGR